jgi:DNA replication protein DnaC
MRQITDVIKEMQNDLTVSINEMENRQLYQQCKNLSWDDFSVMMTIEGTRQILMRNIDREFIIDESNYDCLRKLYVYITGKMNIEKINPSLGILLLGGIGTGKTILMKAFTGVILRLTSKMFAYFNAFDLNRAIITNGTELYSKKPLMIDDLGKEQSLIKDYGTDTRPILELFALRYDTGAITFATSNYKVKTFTEKYGEQTVERFIEMFNVIELIGKSRRL